MTSVDPPIVSVVVPVHNASRTLRRCVNSLLLQTLKNIEVILVENGSNDDSAVLCERLVRGDRRIKVFSTERSGVSLARNIGIRSAMGEYLSFVDADDWLSPSALEEALHLAKDSMSELVFFDYFNTNSLEECFAKPAHSNFPDLESVAPEESLRWMIEGRYYWNVWQMLVLRSAIVESKILFPEDIDIGEDMQFSFFLHNSVSSVSFLKTAHYGYFENPVSTMSKVSGLDMISKRLRDTWEVNSTLEVFIDTNFKGLHKDFHALLARLAFVDLLSISQLGESGLTKAWITKLQSTFSSNSRFLNYSDYKSFVRVILVKSHLIQLKMIANFVSKFMRMH